MARKILRFKQINPFKTSSVIVSQNTTPAGGSTTNPKPKPTGGSTTNQKPKPTEEEIKQKIDNQKAQLKSTGNRMVDEFYAMAKEFYNPAFEAIAGTITAPSIASSRAFKNTMDAANKIYDQSGADAAGKYLNSMAQLYRDNLVQFKNINTACSFLNRHYGTSQYNLDWIISEASRLGIIQKTTDPIDNQLQLVNANVGDLILNAINIANNVAEEDLLSAVGIALRLPARIGRNPEYNTQILSTFGNDTLYGLNPFKNILEADKNPGTRQNNISMLVMMEAFTAGVEKAVELIKKLQEFFGFLDTGFSKELYVSAVVAEKLQNLAGSQLEAIKTTWFKGNLAIFENSLSTIIPLLKQYQKENMIHDLGQIAILVSQALAASALSSAISPQSSEESQMAKKTGSKFVKYRLVIAQEPTAPWGGAPIPPEVSEAIKETKVKTDNLGKQLIKDKNLAGQAAELFWDFISALEIKASTTAGIAFSTLNTADFVKKIHDTFYNITVPAINTWADSLASLKVTPKTYTTMSKMIANLASDMNLMFIDDQSAIKKIKESIAAIFGEAGRVNMPDASYGDLSSTITESPAIFNRVIKPIQLTLAMWSNILSSISTDAFVQPSVTQATQETSPLGQREPSLVDMAKLQEQFNKYIEYVDTEIFTSKDFLSALSHVINLISLNNLKSKSKSERMQYQRMLLETKSGLLKILRSRLDAEVYSYKLPLENKLRINNAKKRKLEEHEKLLMGKTVPYAPYAITIAIQQLVQNMAQDYDVFIGELGSLIKKSKSIAATVSTPPLNTFFGSGTPLQRNIINFLGTEINNAEAAKTAILAEAYSRKTGKEQGLV